jgi:SNF2 family DNA or RNA helicase
MDGSSVTLRWKPRVYQKRAMRFMLERPAAGLFLDPGLGKTSVTLGAFKVYQQQTRYKRMLVVAPLRVCHSVWPEEISKWKDFEHMSYTILHGPSKNELLHEKSDIYLVNPEGLAWLVEAAEHEGWKWPTLLVVDESTKFKHTNTKRFKLIKKHVLNRARRRYILTGRPAPNGYEDLFGQTFILDRGQALGEYITHYRIQYFFQSGFGGYTWTLQPGAEKKIQRKLRPLVMRLDARDYLKLPAMIEKDISVDLPSKAQQQYKKFERDLVLQLKEGTVIAQNAGTLTQKLRQVANGALYIEVAASRKKKVSAIHDGKLEALQDLIEELSGQPIIVCYEFKHDLQRIRATIGKNTPAVGGGVSAKLARDAISEWNAGNLPVLLTQPQSAGHGLNLQGGGHHMVWFGLPWDLDVYDQMIRRIYRQGQKERVFIYHLVSRGTVDRLVLSTLRKKSKTQKALLDALRVKYKFKRK